MAIAEDASTPAPLQRAYGTSGTAASASFSPPAGSWVYVLVSWMYGASGITSTITCQDSLGNAYTAGPVVNSSGTTSSAALFRFRYATAPGSITVTAASTSVAGASVLLAPRVVTGAAASQTGAATATSTTTGTVSVTTTTTGSWVYLAGGSGSAGTITPNGSSSSINTWSDAAGSGDDGAAGRGASATGTPGATTLGWTSGITFIAAWEVLPAITAVTSTGSLALAPLAVTGTVAGGVTTATGSLALAPLAVAGTGGTGAATTATGSVALAPLAVSGAAGGGNITATGSLALAPLSVQATGAGGDIPGAPPVALLPVLPQIIVEAGLIPDSPTQVSTALRLDDPTFGKLDTATLGTSITWTDISQWVISFTITRPSTRQQGPLWNYQAGTISILLDNADGRFDPDNLTGPYTPGGVTQLVPMVPVRVRTAFASVAYANYSGFADGWLPGTVTYEGGYAEITLPASDAFKVLAGITLPALTSPVGVAADTGARVRDILNRAGWYTSAERLAIATGNSTLQGTTLGADPLALMQIATDSEIGQLYVNGSGAVVFRNRRALLTDTRSNTVQAVFGDRDGPLPLLWQVQWNGNGSTANPGAQSQLTGGVAAGSAYQASAVFYSPQGWPSAQLDVNWFTAGGGYISTSASPPVSIPAGAAALVATGPLTAPATATQYTIVPQMLGTPASSVVMTAAWNHAAGTPELTSAPVSWTWTANNSSTVANLGAAPAAWYPVELPYAAVGRASDDTTIANDVQATIAGGSNLQEVRDAASIAKYLFPRTYARTDLILQNDSDALNWAQWVLYISRGGEDRFDSLQVDPQSDPYNLWPQVLGREIGDRIQVVNRPAGLTTPVVKDCFIAGITHVWDSVHSTWLTTWTLQDASKYGAFFTLDNPTLGRLDANALTF